MQQSGKITFAAPPSGPRSPRSLYLISALFFLVSASAAVLGASYMYCPSQIIPSIKPFCDDAHYRYLVPLLVPVTAWFAIANWVGWEYFKYS